MPDGTKETKVSKRRDANRFAGGRTPGRPGSGRSWPVPAATQRGLAHWVTLIIVLALGIIVGIVAWKYLTSRSYTQNVEEVKQHVSTAQKVSAKDVKKALDELKHAQEVLKRFDESDPKRLELKSVIKRAEDEVNEACRKELEQLIAKGDLVGARDFYEHQAKAIDRTGDLQDLLGDSIEVGKLVDEMKVGLRTARQDYDDKKLETALDLICDLDKKVTRTKLISDRIVSLREEIEGLKDKWVKEARAKATQAFNQGRLDEARDWFAKLAERYIDDQGLRRELEEMVSRIRQKEVVGVVVRVKDVQLVDAGSVKRKLFEQLKERLAGRSFLAIELSGMNDSKGAQLGTFLVADYSEMKGKQFVSPDRSMRAFGTNITCSLRIQKRGGRRPIWTKRLGTKTPDKLSLEGRQFGAKLLRDNAVAIFATILKSVELPAEQLRR